jgi:hypothetical protein
VLGAVVGSVVAVVASVVVVSCAVVLVVSEGGVVAVVAVELPHAVARATTVNAAIRALTKPP